MSGVLTWQVVIQKQYQQEYYVNDYYIQASAFLDARNKALQIVAIERAVHTTGVAFINMRLRVAGSAGQGTVVPIGQNGLSEASNFLPLYCTVRVDMGPDEGRPGRKYLRLPLTELAQDNGVMNQTYVDTFNTLYAIPIQNLGFVCKETGTLFTNCKVNPVVQMRQLRRGSKRRLQPII